MKTKSELFIRDLGDGLILRHASSADVDALVDINSRMHSDDGPDKPNHEIGIWVRDLLTHPHPTLVPGDFTVVEETTSGRIVSTLCLIPQTWSFDGIEFGVGRPELVCTLPEFRNRGLIRIQMNEIHKWSDEREHLVQVITGIPNYYRQFGYDMALDFSGGRRGFEAHVPVLKEEETESIVFRPANETDVDFILQTYESFEKRHAVSCKRSPEIVRYEILGKSIGSMNHYMPVVLEDRAGARIGFINHPTTLWSGGLVCLYYALADGVSWFDVSSSVVRYLWEKGAEFAARESTSRTSFGFGLGEYHPVYDVLSDRLPLIRTPYSYYMRVPNMVAFLERIKPALEIRLADSVAFGYTGELTIGFYKSGIRMVFEKGKITLIEPLKKFSYLEVDVNFPDQTFLHLLFGHRSFDELRHAFTDCYMKTQTARVLMNSLFPKRQSTVYPVS